jgi:hypothetical protein
MAYRNVAASDWALSSKLTQRLMHRVEVRMLLKLNRYAGGLSLLDVIKSYNTANKGIKSFSSRNYPDLLPTKVYKGLSYGMR